jgi:hypothetical protein
MIDRYTTEAEKVSCTDIQKQLIRVMANVMKKQQPTMPDKYNEIVDRQIKIGWNQMLYGRLSTEWAKE